jgi:hypothetical protein
MGYTRQRGRFHTHLDMPHLPHHYWLQYRLYNHHFPRLRGPNILLYHCNRLHCIEASSRRNSPPFQIQPWPRGAGYQHFRRVVPAPCMGHVVFPCGAASHSFRDELDRPHLWLSYFVWVGLLLVQGEAHIRRTSGFCAEDLRETSTCILHV